MAMSFYILAPKRRWPCSSQSRNLQWQKSQPPKNARFVPFHPQIFHGRSDEGPTKVIHWGSMRKKIRKCILLRENNLKYNDKYKRLKWINPRVLFNDRILEELWMINKIPAMLNMLLENWSVTAWNCAKNYITNTRESRFFCRKLTCDSGDKSW